MASTLTSNAAARGAARAAGTPIVNAQPATAPKGTSVVPALMAPAPAAPIQYTTRVAEANAAQQVQKHAQALQTNLSEDLKKQAAKAAADLASGAITAEEAQATMDNIHRLATSDSAGVIQAGADAATAAQSTLFNDDGSPNPAAIMKMAGLQGDQQTYNAKTGNTQLAGKGNLEQAAVTRLREAGLDDNQIKRALDAIRPQLSSTASNTGLGGSFDAKTGMFVAPSEATAAARTRLGAIDARMNELNQPLVFDGLYSYLDHTQAATLSAKREEEKAALAKERADLIKKTTDLQNAGQGNVPGAAPDGTKPTDNTGQNNSAPDPNAPPAPGATDPITQMQTTDMARIKTANGPLDSAIEDAKKNALVTRDTELALIGQPDDAGYADEKTNIKQAFDNKLKFNAEVDQLTRDRTLETERSSLSANDRARELAGIENAKAELDQQKLNVENELTARRSVNKLGGGHDYSGLRYIQKTVQDGLDSLNYLRAKAASMQGAFGDKAVEIINKYGLDMRGVDITAKKDYSDAYNTYLTDLKNAKKDFNATKKDIRDKTFQAHKDYSATLTQLDLKKGEMIKDVTLKHMDNMNSLAKLRVQMQHQDIGNAIKMLAMATKKGVTMSPAAMANFEKQVAPNLPPGWMKFSQGGGGGAGANYKVWTPEGLASAQVWLSKQPGRSFTDLVPSDQQWLVPMSQPIPGTGGNAAQWMGPGAVPVDNSPKTGFDAEQPKEQSSSTYVKEYDTIVQRTGKAPIGSDGKPMSLQDYFAQRGFNPMLAAPPSAPRRTDAAPEMTTATDDAAMEDWLYSDPDTFDFNSDIP